MKNKRTIITGAIVAAVVVLGIVLALLLSPITTFLHGGTADDFRNAGTCAARRTETVTPTPDNDSIVILDATPTPVDAVLTAAPDGVATQAPVTAVVPTEPTATPQSYESLYEQADTSMMKDIVNILLVGVDYSEERLTWNGKKEWHSDVMIVLSVNFAEGRADLISLPRDTYAKIPGVKGIYKLNAALNCGGGLYDSNGNFHTQGLEKVCEAAEWMLGGIPVDYYYAVTMTSLKSLVDAFGGLDYDLDISFTIQGRSYQKGMQHMNGQAVLDYCRVRKTSNGLSSSDAGDANRVNRQKRILIAFFDHLKTQNMIVRIPDIIKAFNSGGDQQLYTNCTPAQTAALAAFAYRLNRSDIGMYSMGGSSQSYFQWNFVFTDQSNRVDIIEKVYGVSVKKYHEYTLKYARYRWCSMLYDQYIDNLVSLDKYVQGLIDEDDLLPEFTASPVPTATVPPTDRPVVTDAPTDKPMEKATEVPAKVSAQAPTKVPTQAPTEVPTQAPTEVPTQAPTKVPTQAPTEVPTQVPTEPPAQEKPETNTALGRILREETRHYTNAQRNQFYAFQAALDELDECKRIADKEAKKAAKGNSNDLDSASKEYLAKLGEVQKLAIDVANTFNFTKIKNFTTAYSPTDTYWKTGNPWAVNYGLKSKFNEIRVDFN